MFRKTGNISFTLIFIIMLCMTVNSQELADDPNIADTIYVDSVMSTSATRGFVPIYFYNDEDLAGVELTLMYDSPEVRIDSFSFVGGRLEAYSLKGADPLFENTITIYSFTLSEALIPSGSGLMGNLYFSYLPGITSHVVTIDTMTLTIGEREFSTAFSDASANFFKPEFVGGYLNIQPTSCCLGDRGNADGSIDDVLDISDVIFLVDFMFNEGPEAVCTEEANIDGSLDGVVDIADVVFIIDFVLNDGAFPSSCP